MSSAAFPPAACRHARLIRVELQCIIRRTEETEHLEKRARRKALCERLPGKREARRALLIKLRQARMGKMNMREAFVAA